jgi:hypothetical protein
MLVFCSLGQIMLDVLMANHGQTIASTWLTLAKQPFHRVVPEWRCGSLSRLELQGVE